MTEKESLQRPFFGVQKNLIERIHSLDKKWYVEFWDEHFFFLGIEVYTRKREKVVQINSKRSDSSSLQAV